MATWPEKGVVRFANADLPTDDDDLRLVADHPVVRDVNRELFDEPLVVGKLAVRAPMPGHGHQGLHPDRGDFVNARADGLPLTATTSGRGCRPCGASASSHSTTARCAWCPARTPRPPRPSTRMGSAAGWDPTLTRCASRLLPAPPSCSRAGRSGTPGRSTTALRRVSPSPEGTPPCVCGIRSEPRGRANPYGRKWGPGLTGVVPLRDDVTMTGEDQDGRGSGRAAEAGP